MAGPPHPNPLPLGEGDFDEQAFSLLLFRFDTYCLMPTEAPTLELKQTINLPKTKFGQKANLPQSEPARLQKWADMNLYEQIRKARAGAEKFILHDGPPYANADIHLGTAMNKILKDLIVKSRTMLAAMRLMCPVTTVTDYR